MKPVSKASTKDASFKSLKSWLNGNHNEETEETPLIVWSENLSQKDFSTVPADELDELMRSIKALSKRFAAHLNRRYKNQTKQIFPDLRKTLRKNMRQGGELIEIAFRKPKRNRTKLVVLCDVSKSMDLYASFLFQFMFAFQQVFSRMETFAFSTHYNILLIFETKQFSETLRLLSAQNNNWSGGTRIGESLDSILNRIFPFAR